MSDAIVNDGEWKQLDMDDNNYGLFNYTKSSMYLDDVIVPPNYLVTGKYEKKEILYLQ